MQAMLGVRDQVLEQARKFCLDAIILADTMELFQPAPGVTQKDDPSTSALGVFTLFLFFLILFYFLKCFPGFFPGCNNI